MTAPGMRRLTAAAPSALLLCTLASVALFGPERRLFLGQDHHNLHDRLTLADSMTYDHLWDAIGMWPRRYLVSTRSVDINADGEIVPGRAMYNRYPVGGRLLLHLATRPFDDPWRKVRAARTLVIICFVAAAMLAYSALTVLMVNHWAAVAATLLAFGSGYHLTYHDMVATQGMMDMFGFMLVFHAMAVFSTPSAHRRPRLGQLLAKTAVALMLGWHVYGLLLPFVALGIALGAVRADWSRIARHVALGATALAVGTCALAFNMAGEFLALGGQTPWAELPSVRSILWRTGWWSSYWGDLPLARSPVPTLGGWTLDALWTQFARVGEATLPHVFTGSLPVWRENAGVFFLGWTGVVATLAAIGLGATARRGRVALTSMAVAGWCWSLPMRNALSGFEYEALFFVGVPLVLLAVGLAWIGGGGADLGAETSSLVAGGGRSGRHMLRVLRRGDGRATPRECGFRARSGAASGHQSDSRPSAPRRRSACAAVQRPDSLASPLPSRLGGTPGSCAGRGRPRGPCRGVRAAGRPVADATQPAGLPLSSGGLRSRLGGRCRALPSRRGARPPGRVVGLLRRVLVG